MLLLRCARRRAAHRRRRGCESDRSRRPARPIHREDSPSWTRRSASASSSPRWRSRRTTRSASRSSRSCARACSRRGSARRPGSTDDVRDDRLLGGAAALRRLHRPRPRGRDPVRRRDRDPRPDARPRRRATPPRSCATSWRSRRPAAARGGARRDRPDDPGDGPRVGGAQLHLRVRGGRHARRSGSTSARASARRCASRSSAGTATASRPTRRARRSRSPMRVVHLSHDMEAIGRLFSPRARARGRARPPRPHLRPGARRPVRRARARVVRPAAPRLEPWDAVLALEPEPRRDAGRARSSTTR